jgi:hypothetical protein
MSLLPNASALVESLKCSVEIAGDVMITGGTIGFILVFWALVRGT